MKKIQTLILILFSTHLYAAAAPWIGDDLRGRPCRTERQGYGPYDYTKAGNRSKFPIVEDNHLTENVQYHIRGESGTVPGDLDYTLRAIPNHHVALLSMIRYQVKLNKRMLSNPKPLLNSPECYLQRAIYFSPKDAFSISLYAYYLKEINKPEKAADLYEKALAIDPNNSKILYSYSLLLISVKKHEKALEFAKKAYEHGNPPPGLKNKLINLGVWRQENIQE